MAEYAFKDVITAKDIMTQEISVIDLLGRERKGWFLNSMPEYIDANTLHRLHSPRRLVDVNPFSMTPFKDDRGDCYCLFISEKKPGKKYVPFDLSDPKVRKGLRGKVITTEDTPFSRYVEGVINCFELRDTKVDGVDCQCWFMNGISAEELMNNWKFEDGSPCGRLVEEDR